MSQQKKLPGDGLIGTGIVLAIVGVVLALISDTGAVWPWFLSIGGLLLVVIGYLQRKTSNASD